MVRWRGRITSHFVVNIKRPLEQRNVVHLSGAALRLTGYRVFDIFTALGRLGLGRLSIKRMDKSPLRLFKRLGVLPSDNALLITFS